MYKTILVPLDGSRLAESILPYVEELARLGDATIIFLQVVDLPHSVGIPKGEAYDAMPHMTTEEANRRVAEAQRYLDGLVERLRDQGIAARGLVEYGPVVATILRIAQEQSASLIGLASHGRGGHGDVYYGSVAAGVVQRVDRPLLIVRAQ
jgi:nucleotide-binding universal stress UspA family protein